MWKCINTTFSHLVLNVVSVGGGMFRAQATFSCWLWIFFVCWCFFFAVNVRSKLCSLKSFTVDLSHRFALRIGVALCQGCRIWGYFLGNSDCKMETGFGWLFCLLWGFFMIPYWIHTCSIRDLRWLMHFILSIVTIFSAEERSCVTMNVRLDCAEHYTLRKIVDHRERRVVAIKLTGQHDRRILILSALFQVFLP